MLAVQPGTISITVKGPWRSRRELVEAVMANNRDFLLGGEELFNRRSRFRLSLHCEADHEGQQLRCSSYEVSVRGAKELQHAGTALLCAGGSQIMVDSIQLKHSPAYWAQLDQAGRTLDLYAAYVRFLAAESSFGSFGMHNFGLPDVRLPANVGLVEASRTISAFNLYVLIEQPHLATGHTFCAADDAPRFRLRRLDQAAVEEIAAEPNPHGAWSLLPA